MFEKFLSFGAGKTDAIMVDNSEWLMKLNYIEFLRDVGRHMSVNRMLTMDSVKLRLEREQPMSFIEFNYMVLQAYDFVELHRRYGCTLQMGGSDQWGNIVNGVELGRRMDGVELFGLTQPLITTASGAKMGKTAQGAVWLNADMLEPVRLLAILAQRRGRRRRPLPENLHRPAARGDRAPRSAAGRRDQRRQEGARHRSDGAAARARRSAESRGSGARDVRTRRALGEPADLPGHADELAQGLRVAAAFVRAGLVASNGEAKRAHRAPARFA